MVYKEVDKRRKGKGVSQLSALVLGVGNTPFDNVYGARISVRGDSECHQSLSKRFLKS